MVRWAKPTLITIKREEWMLETGGIFSAIIHCDIIKIELTYYMYVNYTRSKRKLTKFEIQIFELNYPNELFNFIYYWLLIVPAVAFEFEARASIKNWNKRDILIWSMSWSLARLLVLYFDPHGRYRPFSFQT